MASNTIAVLFLIDALPHGRKGEIKQVAAGMARNMLIPQKKAVLATPDVLARHSAEQAKKQAAAQGALAAAQELAAKLADTPLHIDAKGTAEKLYGSVDAATLQAAATAAGLGQLPLGNLHLKTPGEHKLVLQLHPQVQGTLLVRITPAA